MMHNIRKDIATGITGNGMGYSITDIQTLIKKISVDGNIDMIGVNDTAAQLLGMIGIDGSVTRNRIYEVVEEMLTGENHWRI